MPIIQALRSQKEFLYHSTHPEVPINLLHAKNAIHGQMYYCPDCGVPLFAKTNQNATSFYSCYRDNPHKKEKCKRIASSSSKRIKTVDDPHFKDSNFFACLIPSIPKQANTCIGKGSFGGDGGKTDENNNTDDNYHYSPSSTIKDIIDENLHIAKPNLIINETNHIKVEDIILSVYSINSLFDDPNILDQKPKIVIMIPFMSYSSQRVYYAKMYRKIKRSTSESITKTETIYFRLRIDDESKPYSDFYKKTFSRGINANNKPVDIPKYKYLYVCGIWKISDKPYFENRKPCLTFDCIINDFSKQIYHSNDNLFNKKENSK